MYLVEINFFYYKNQFFFSRKTKFAYIFLLLKD